MQPVPYWTIVEENETAVSKQKLKVKKNDQVWLTEETDGQKRTPQKPSNTHFANFLDAEAGIETTESVVNSS